MKAKQARGRLLLTSFLSQIRYGTPNKSVGLTNRRPDVKEPFALRNSLRNGVTFHPSKFEREYLEENE